MQEQKSNLFAMTEKCITMVLEIIKSSRDATIEK